MIRSSLPTPSFRQHFRNSLLPPKKMFRHSLWPLCLQLCNWFSSGISCLEKKHATKMSDCPGALTKLVLRKLHTETSFMKLKFSARKAVHDCYQCWKFELKISSDSGDMHFSAIKHDEGVVPPQGKRKTFPTILYSCKSHKKNEFIGTWRYIKSHACDQAAACNYNL